MICKILYFNTSHVNVNQHKEFAYTLDDIDFNTSHVNVNRYINIATARIISISIHLMLMLICTMFRMKNLNTYFNTSHVNVNRLLHNETINSRKFQYISC